MLGQFNAAGSSLEAGTTCTPLDRLAVPVWNRMECFTGKLKDQAQWRLYLQ